MRDKTLGHCRHPESEQSVQYQAPFRCRSELFAPTFCISKRRIFLPRCSTGCFALGHSRTPNFTRRKQRGFLLSTSHELSPVARNSLTTLPFHAVVWWRSSSC